MKKEEFNEILQYLENAKVNNSLMYNSNIDSGKIFLAATLRYITKDFNEDQLKFYLDNYNTIKKFQDTYHLDAKTIKKYIEFFSRKKCNIHAILPNKKVKFTENIIRQKITDHFNFSKYDVDSFNIKVGNVDLVCFRIEKNTYEVKQYINDDYILIVKVELKELKLKPLVF